MKVIMTERGDKYHASEYCPQFAVGRRTSARYGRTLYPVQLVNRNEAKRAGKTPCKSDFCVISLSK